MKNKAIKIITLFVVLLFSSCAENEIIREPKAISVTQIDLTNFPASKPNGSGWDLNSGPDIFMTISAGTSSSSSDKVTGTELNVSASQSLSFILSTPYTINNLSSQWAIGAYDSDDFDPDDFIGGVFFTPIDFKKDLPATLPFNAGNFQGVLHVTWNF